MSDTGPLFHHYKRHKGNSFFNTPTGSDLLDNIVVELQGQGHIHPTEQQLIDALLDCLNDCANPKTQAEIAILLENETYKGVRANIDIRGGID